MRKGHHLFIIAALLGSAAALSVGCIDLVAEYYTPLTDPNRFDGGVGGADGGGGSGGDGGSIPTGCEPSKNNDPVADTCGVFVSPTGDDGNPGTKAKPLKTLTAAVAKGSTIYACAGATPFNEAVVVADKAVTLFGALNCAKGWVYDASKKTQLTAGADEIPLKLMSGASGSDVYDFAITAADAMADGGSSIAVIGHGVTASFTRTDITAGNAKGGLPGTTPTDPVGPTDPNDAAIKGNAGKHACSDPSQQFGGAAKENELCPAASGGPIGGKGGAADTLSGTNGEASAANKQTALGGVGQPNQDPTNSWDCVPGSGLGATGTKGGSGDVGIGAQSIGTVDKNGYTGAAGGSGGLGRPGQGGGGGGGAKGKSMCAGASGGGGGAGGCGGKGGMGGQAGGASIGIISLGATLSFEAVTIEVGTGGHGGDGGDGQVGGTGGNGGQGGLGNNTGQNLSNACSGGSGGQGGVGGKGGGGRGGHAIGIAHTGTTAPATKGVTFATKGTPGGGGSGDTMNGNMGNGAPGVAEDVQAFP